MAQLRDVRQTSNNNNISQRVFGTNYSISDPDIAAIFC